MRHIVLTAMLVVGAITGCAKNLVNPFPQNYVGVGIELTMRDESPVVVRTIDGGPAQAAGLQPDDQILSIDNASTAGLGLADVVVKLRGAEGSSVYVTLRRKGVEIAANIVRRGLQKSGDDYATQSLRAAAK